MRQQSIFTAFIILTYMCGGIQSAENASLKEEVEDVEMQYMFLKKHFGEFTLEKLISSMQERKSMDDLNPLCKIQLNEYMTKSKPEDFKDGIWALQMEDAWGKFPEGVLRGHLSVLGDFDECIRIRGIGTDNAEQIKGRHCYVHVIPSDDSIKRSQIALNAFQNHGPKGDYPYPVISYDDLTALQFSVLTLGACFPDTCKRKDVQKIFNQTKFQTLVSNCYTDEKPQLAAPAITVICFLSGLLAFVILGTLMDGFIRFTEGDVRKWSKYRGTKLLLGCSLHTNSQKIFRTKMRGRDLGCLHGIRFLSMCWLVLYHTWARITYNYNWNLQDVPQLYDRWTMLAILNGTLSVDTFFTIAGLLVCFNLLKAFDATKGAFNPLSMYLRRYLRLTPTYAVMIAIVATIRPYLSTGPNWAIIDIQAQYCRRNWWHNLLYINNLMSYNVSEDPLDGVCYRETWYLANDMQFFLIAPFLVFLLWKWQRIGICVMGILSFLSALIPGLVTFLNGLPPTSTLFGGGINNSNSPYKTELYYKPWTRFGPYIIGIWTGLILHKMIKSGSGLPARIIPIGWGICTGAALAILFGPIGLFNSAREYGDWEAGIYASLHRNCWALVIAWIILACIDGKGGIVNSILSSKLFIPLGRVTYCVYLVSLQLQLVFVARVRQAIIYDTYTQVNLFFSHLSVSLLVGFLLTVLVESPFTETIAILFPVKRENGSKKANNVPVDKPPTSIPLLEVNASEPNTIKINH